MNTSKIKIGIVAVAAAFMTLATSCKKEDMSMTKDATPEGAAPDKVEPGSLAIRMAASPMESAKMVNIEITGVEVQYMDGMKLGNWTGIAVTPKVYNMLKYTNGPLAILADLNNQIASGQIVRVRLTLGYHNSVITQDGRSHPLVVSQSNRIVVIGAKTIISKEQKALVDLKFNTMQSVSSEDGTYILTPSISLKGIQYIPVTNEQ